MTIKLDDELAESQSMANLLELERLSVEVAVLRDCAASLAKERDQMLSAANGRHKGNGAVVRLRAVRS